MSLAQSRHSLVDNSTPPGTLPLPPLPRRHRSWISPQAFPLLSCFLFQSFQHRIPWRILPIPPAPPLLHEFLSQVRSIGQKHSPKGASVLVVAMCLDGDCLPEGEVRGGVLGVVAVGLALLRAVDAAQADAFSAVAVQDSRVSQSRMLVAGPEMSEATTNWAGKLRNTEQTRNRKDVSRLGVWLKEE